MGYEEFRERLAAYLTHYNETRIKKSLDWMSPRAIPQKSWTGRLTVQKNIRTPSVRSWTMRSACAIA